MTVFSRRTIGPKSRRTRGQVIAVVIAAVVVVVLIAEVITDAVNVSPKVGARAFATWLAAVDPLLSSSSAMGPAVARVESADASMTRPVLDATIETLTSVTAANATDNASLGIQAPSASDAALVERVLGSRSTAATDLARSVAWATTPPASGQAAVANCVSASSAIRDADVAIGELNHAVHSVRGVPHQAFRTWDSFGASLGQSSCASLVRALQTNSALTLRAALKLVAISILPSPVQINGVPNPTTTTSTTLPRHSSSTTTTSTTLHVGTATTTTTSTTTTTTVPATTTTQIPPSSARSVLPPTGVVTADVVVADTGTAPIKHVRVQIAVVGSGADVLESSVASVGEIRAGSSAYLTIGPVHLGKLTGTFELRVTASASGVASAKQVITLVRSS